MAYPSYSRHIASNGPLTFVSSEDLSFVIGAFLGDGSFVEDSAWHHHVKLAVRDRELADAFNCSVAKILRRRVNVVTVTHDVGKVYYESKYSSRPLGLFLKGPLEQLRSFVEHHSGAFLNGLFSADGCAAVSNSRVGLRVAVILSNSRLELLSMVEEMLRTHFDIHSKIYRGRRRGATWRYGGKTVVLRKDSYNLCIFRKQDIRTFDGRIGFVTRRKQDAAERAIHLIDSLGRSRAAEVWRASFL